MVLMDSPNTAELGELTALAASLGLEPSTPGASGQHSETTRTPESGLRVDMLRRTLLALLKSKVSNGLPGSGASAHVHLFT